MIEIVAVVDALRQFREFERMEFNSTDKHDASDEYIEGYLNGIEAAKNEVWRLSGSRPF